MPSASEDIFGFRTPFSNSPSMSQDDDFHIMRRDIRAVLVTAIHSEPCHGGIFPTSVVLPNFQPAVLGAARPLLSLWTQWINISSPNVAFIPPEGVLALPLSTGDNSKTDSWAVGCLTLWFINNGQPLELARHMRYISRAEVFHNFHLKQPLLPRLQALYKTAGQHNDLLIGPKINPSRPVPSVCEDFLGQCLKLDPAKRWSLQQLRDHPFLDLSKSTEELFTLDLELFKERSFLSECSFKEMFGSKNVWEHPVFHSYDAMVSHQRGELIYEHPGLSQRRPVDIWRFTFCGYIEKKPQRQFSLWTNCFGQLVNALTMEAWRKEWATICRMRELQEGSKNVVQHFGCQFFGTSNSTVPMEMLLITEHCAGGSFKEAAKYKLPIEIIAKWTREVLQGLQYLYGHRIVHGNINSCHILFSDSGFKGTIKIGGFHYMRRYEADPDSPFHCSSPQEVKDRQEPDGRFAAPESIAFHIADEKLGRKSDIWSMGCVVLHLVSGEPPLYTGPKNKLITLEIAIQYHFHINKNALPCIDEWIPTSVQVFIKSCLQFDPQKRPSINELLKKLETGSFGIIRQFRPDTAQYLANRKGEPLPVDVAEHWRTHP
ncbi:uncharacterized protein LOC129597462 [Paramacrobiotus metropolitanus]|uniref:uncharacterized protein LOC129597462 n=1 Tax=Paramacrobiotus metropolitanus TaxID=2943436 RepID=UPI0024461677|nr:uncharacterized protein LOC129597462 [Paramacrobiotus metropolitanus]